MEGSGLIEKKWIDQKYGPGPNIKNINVEKWKILTSKALKCR